eukprot:CAMPEP_0117426220 /NCGR_PEP_ID=MMETSP0758-20121206/6380_1 /TAXON_ID=63605 /ORGANISM="Percolomonas cosmopolitus, Strain AE-1 (ATCC 50343)" /LENGTH=157 /DNA_ID=CAMNT_0005211263 /DNA_START=745 /DNA_END=1215 /DNA_ORIENTATION=-
MPQRMQYQAPISARGQRQPPLSTKRKQPQSARGQRHAPSPRRSVESNPPPPTAVTPSESPTREKKTLNAAPLRLTERSPLRTLDDDSDLEIDDDDLSPPPSSKFEIHTNSTSSSIKEPLSNGSPQQDTSNHSTEPSIDSNEENKDSMPDWSAKLQRF